MLQQNKMADEDEIDILGDFSFNSCFAQNNQGIPSCSNREDTVHPEWLLDSTVTNWYDKHSRKKEGSSRKLYGDSSANKITINEHTAWSQTEQELLLREMAKYGRNVRKIAQTLKSKTEAEIQALIEAEYGVNLESPLFGLERHEESEDVPVVVQEEIVADETTNINNIIKMVKTGSPTITTVPKKPFRNRKVNSKSLLRPDVLKTDLIAINPSEILYEDDMVVGSTESIGSDLDLTDIVSKDIVKYQVKVKGEKKIGNHRRKVSRNYDKGRTRNRSKDILKSPQGRQRKDSSMSEDNVKSPKLQIVLGSGQALPVSEGEQIIKIEKKKVESESDIEIDIDSDKEDSPIKDKQKNEKAERQTDKEAPIAVPLRKFEPMPRRKKKINLDGGGGYTIMHTEAGDLYEVGSEPRKERQPRKQPIHLLHCRVYNTENPAPYEVRLNVSTLILLDIHGHTSRAEVMGLLGGTVDGEQPLRVHVWVYKPAAAAADGTHCDMNPVSQAAAAAAIWAVGGRVCGWQHSHPCFPAAPSRRDLRTQLSLQRALERPRRPFLGLVTSQHWPAGRTASHYRCIRAEDGEDPDNPIGYQLNVKLTNDLTASNLPAFLQELKTMARDDFTSDKYSVDMEKDICPQAKISYLEKCISSISHHLRSAGYTDDDLVVEELLKGIRDVFR